MFKRLLFAAVMVAGLAVAETAQADQAHLNWAASVAKNAQISAYYANPNATTHDNGAGCIYLEWYVHKIQYGRMSICQIRSHYQKIYNKTPNDSQVNRAAKFWTGHMLDVIDMYHYCP